MSAVSAVLSRLDRIRAWQEDFYRDLHQHPELSHQEHRTAAKVAERLPHGRLQVHDGVGGTGVVGVLANGDGPTVLLRADMDALPVREATGLPYASTVTATDADGQRGAGGARLRPRRARRLPARRGPAARRRHRRTGTARWWRCSSRRRRPATAPAAWSTTTSPTILPAADVAFAQHVLPAPAGQVGTRTGPMLSAADSMRITVHGRGGARLDAAGGGRPGGAGRDDRGPAADRRLPRGGADGDRGAHRRQHPGRHEEQRHPRPGACCSSTCAPTASRPAPRCWTRSAGSSTAECQASGCPKDPEFELFDRFPLTDNDAATTERVAAAFAGFFGDRAGPIGPADRQRGLQRHPRRPRRAVHLLGHRRHRRRHLPRGRAGRPGRPGHPGQPLRRTSPRSSSPPWTPGPRRWSSPPSPGSAADTAVSVPGSLPAARVVVRSARSADRPSGSAKHTAAAPSAAGTP